MLPGRPPLRDQRYLHIRAPHEIRAAIQDLAEEETRHITQMALVLLKEALRERARRAAHGGTNAGAS